MSDQGSSAASGIIAKGLSCERGGRRVFEGVDFAVAPGAALLLRGPNGSGKTSLLRMIAGFLEPPEGRLTWNGRPFGEVDYEAGDDPARGPRQLGNRLALTATTAGSLFLVLVGAGRLLVPSPDASTLMSVVYLGAGLALVPVWVRWGFGRGALVEEVPDSVGDEIISVSVQHEAAMHAAPPVREG